LRILFTKREITVVGNNDIGYMNTRVVLATPCYRAWGYARRLVTSGYG